MPTEQNFFTDTKRRLQEYVQQRMLLLRLQATQKISRIASTMITIIFVILIGLFLLIFGSITAGLWLTHLTGSSVEGFGIVALFYLFVFLFIIIFLKKILQTFFINKLIGFIHKKD